MMVSHANCSLKRINGYGKQKDDILILAIESSCDETAAAVVRNGREILSNIISSD